MSKQPLLDQYFRSKSSLTIKSSPSLVATITMNNKNIKKRSLSLVKSLTPEKARKISSSHVIASETEPVNTEVINLCSDDENTSTPLSKSSDHMSRNSLDASNSSQSTTNNLTPTTPQKSPQTTSSNSVHSKNSQKFYSPNKKRAVFKITPIKKNLAKEFYGNNLEPDCNSVEDDDFKEACKEMDDKSIFLLTIINKCLKDKRLKELFDEGSVEILSRCLHIIKPGIRLICRLYWRQQGWYRTEKLIIITNDKKDNIDDSQFMEMLNCLIKNNLVTAGTNSMMFDDLTKVLKIEEIKQICKDLKLKIQSKQDAENALRRYSQQSSISNFFKQTNSNNSDRVLAILRAKAGTCYKLSDLTYSTLQKLYLLMYLGINYQTIREKKLELVLINDKIKREIYPVDKEMVLDNASVVFRSREEFAKYWSAHIIYEDYLTQTGTSEKCNIVSKVYQLYKSLCDEDMMRYKALPTWLRKYTPPYIYIKILESGVQELKKDKLHHQLAVDILTTLISQIAFRQHKKAMWYAEKALILHKLLARHDEAAQVLLEGLKSDLSEEAKDAMRPRANKIAHQRNIQLAPVLSEALIEYGSKELILEKTFPAEHVWKQHMETSNQRGKKKFEVHTEDDKKFLDAEDYCVLHYTSNGDYTHGEHWEGRIVTTIYFLLFWDVIYTKPPGVVGIFLCHYQLHPLDIYDESFYINRKTLIDERLMNIENMDTDKLIEVMQTKWDERPEYELSNIRRDIGWEKVRMVASCLGARATAALCRRLATNYGYTHSGFPDLTLWNIDTKKIKFVEVKTDTDKPSMKQLQWMQYLRQHGIDTGFCYLGVFSTRCKARATETAETPVTAEAIETAQTPGKAEADETAQMPVKSRSRASETAQTPVKSRSRASGTAQTPVKSRSRASKTAQTPVKSRATSSATADKPVVTVRTVHDINKLEL